MTTRRDFLKGALAGMAGAFLNVTASLRTKKEPDCSEATTPSPAEVDTAFWEERAHHWARSCDYWRERAITEAYDSDGWHRVAKATLRHNNDLYEERICLLKELEKRDKQIAWLRTCLKTLHTWDESLRQEAEDWKETARAQAEIAKKAQRLCNWWYKHCIQYQDDWFRILDQLREQASETEILRGQLVTLREGINTYRQWTGYEPNVLIDKGA